MVAFPENGQDSHFVTLAVEPATVLEASNVVSDTMLSQRRLTTATRFFICQIINFDEILNSNFLRLVLNRNLASAFLPPSPNWFSHQPKLALLRLKRFLFRTGVELYKRYTSRYNPLKNYFFFYNFFCLMKRCELRKSAVHSIWNTIVVPSRAGTTLVYLSCLIQLQMVLIRAPSYSKLAMTASRFPSHSGEMPSSKQTAFPQTCLVYI